MVLSCSMLLTLLELPLSLPLSLLLLLNICRYNQLTQAVCCYLSSPDPYLYVGCAHSEARLLRGVAPHDSVTMW